jgi:glutamyl-Q tRNA(Asp) synthetase
MYTTRFAPSPTGLLHIGNGFSALTGWQRARARGGRFCLRIEDIDSTRCRPAFDAAILADLAWLEIDWDGPVLRQSQRLAVYAEAVAQLRGRGLLYPCFCSRADIAAAVAAPHGPDGPLYTGTCRHLSQDERAEHMAAKAFAWRLDIGAALAQTGRLNWIDAEAGRVAADPLAGCDIVIARKDLGVSYHLAVVIDDAAQGVTEVVRGIDLFPASHVQRLLQALLGLPETTYYHHRLIMAPDGRRLAKRDRDATLASLRAGGTGPEELRTRLLSDEAG